MEVIERSITSPFKLFDSYSENDQDKFFGREEEEQMLYDLIQESNVVLVYGKSGTGKTSLVQCGLAKKNKHFNWTSITIRRLENINQSLPARLTERTDPAKRAELKDSSAASLMREVYLTSFQPVLLIFDQFEELYVFGTPEERRSFYATLDELLNVRVPFKYVFVIKEEYKAELDELEREQPNLFKKQMRVLPMTKETCRNVIIHSCKQFNIELYPLDEYNTKNHNDVVDHMTAILSPGNDVVDLPYVQVFLNTLWEKGRKPGKDQILINKKLVDEVGGMGNIMRAYLEEKINNQKLVNKEDAWKILKLFVYNRNTKKHVNERDLTSIPVNARDLLAYFEKCRIIRMVSDGNYELAHERMTPIIENVKIAALRTPLDHPEIIVNPYKGLTSYSQIDTKIFYGRDDVIKTLFDKVLEGPFTVIVGNSGAGKSSLVKAGIFPRLEQNGYEILKIVRAGDQPLQSIKASIAEAKTNQSVLLIDQYEELITRVNDPEKRQEVYDYIFSLIKEAGDNSSGKKLKIIATVRADFEPQFGITKPLKDYWRGGKYIVPPFTRGEICDIIMEPAYKSGLAFSPPSLVDTIADEVYGSQTTGLLPLMSLSLSELYKKYEQRGRKGNLLLETDYNDFGGVMGVLQYSAEHVYNEFEHENPGNYKKYQAMMKNIMLRMVYLATGELAGQRVLTEDFEYDDPEEANMAIRILRRLKESYLVVSGIDGDGREYYEPAHDVLVRTWSRIWDWLDVNGREEFSIRAKLSVAVNEYQRNNHNDSFLWTNNANLDFLKERIDSDENWMNKKEMDFVRRSRIKCEEFTKIEERQKKWDEQTISWQREQIRRKTRSIIALAVVITVVTGIALFAFYQMGQATKNLVKAQVAGARNNTLIDSQSVLNIALILKNDSLTLVEGEANRAKAEAIRKKDSLDIINKELERKTLMLGIVNKDLTAKGKALALAIRNVSFQSDEVKRKADSLALQKAALQRKSDSLSELIARERNIRDSFNVQQTQNSKQLLTIATGYKNIDLVKSYRIAEMAYKQDSLNQEVSDYFKNQYKTRAYYYSNTLDGSFSAASMDKKYFFTISSLGTLLRICNAESLNQLDSLSIRGDMVSADFTRDNNHVLIVYPRRAEARSLSNIRSNDNFSVPGNNITSASLSPSANTMLTIDNGKLRMFDASGSELVLRVNRKTKGVEGTVNSAVFSPDGKSILASSDKGDVHIIDVINKTYSSKKGYDAVYISPNGKYFLATKAESLELYNSSGNMIKNYYSLIQKYKGIGKVIFSKDGTKVLLHFNAAYFNLSVKGSQKIMSLDKDGTMAVLINLETLAQQEYDSFLDNERLTGLFAGGRIEIDGNWILFGEDDGEVKCFNLNTRQQGLMTGHKLPITSLSVLNGELMLTSSEDRRTKIWRYGTAALLDKEHLLPTLTKGELNRIVTGSGN